MTPENTGKREELERLLARDPFACLLGVVVEQAEIGRVRLSLELRDEHMNFNGSAHGGVLFSLADTAFGLASNAHGVIAVGIHTDMAYSLPGNRGDVLIAEAEEISCSRRVGIYRVTVRRDDGDVIAVFTGTVYRTDKPHASMF
ncbi:PaaI family thioesterase [Pseudomonadota bacterium]